MSIRTVRVMIWSGALFAPLLWVAFLFYLTAVRPSPFEPFLWWEVAGVVALHAIGAFVITTVVAFGLDKFVVVVVVFGEGKTAASMPPVTRGRRVIRGWGTDC